MSEPITMDREYVTRDGRAVQLMTTCSPIDEFPVVGFYATHAGRWGIGTWDDKGCYRSCGLMGHECDLLPKPITHTRQYWLAHSKSGSYLINANLNADYLAKHGREYLAITGPHEITFTEGEGLNE